MCGISGFIGRYSYEMLVEMTDMMIHRGPDDGGYYWYCEPRSGRNIGLGHRRLSIIDLHSGQQPIWNENKDLIIVFNGEIYNYKSIRSSLKQKGHFFRTETDTEVIIHAYEEYGENVVDYLDGMFSFAIWNTSERSLFCARDRFGIKPFFYSRTVNGDMIYASEIKPLLHLTKDRVINPEALYHYLLYGFNSSEETIFKGIFQLLPGHCLRWHNGILKTRRYWHIPPQNTISNEKEAIETIRSALFKAVKSHLVADVPVGITLSGGLDSSSILAVMGQTLMPSSIQSFTTGYGLPSDEIPFARHAAFHVGSLYHERITAHDKVARDFSKMIWHLEEPIVHPVLGTTYYLAEFVREYVKVILIGEGSDELFGGYPHYKLFSFPFTLIPWNIRRKYVHHIAYLMPSAKVIGGLLDNEWLDKELLEYVSHKNDHHVSTDKPQEMLLCDIGNELPYSQLARIDKLTMAHSVEARVPFLDNDFAHAVLGISFHLKNQSGKEKFILRKAMAPYLPEDIINRPKSGKNGSQALLPKMLSCLADREQKYFSTKSIRRRGFFKPESLQKYMGTAVKFIHRHDPIAYRRFLKFRLALITLEDWARIFFDNTIKVK
jgi:asparagine synthase (glutamine-hydrolysing)